jgi:hypothetical protein
MKKWVFIILLLSFISDLVSTLIYDNHSFSYTLSEKTEDSSKKLIEEEDHKKNEDLFHDSHVIQHILSAIVPSYKHYKDSVLHLAYTPLTPPPNKA